MSGKKIARKNMFSSGFKQFEWVVKMGVFCYNRWIYTFLTLIGNILVQTAFGAASDFSGPIPTPSSVGSEACPISFIPCLGSGASGFAQYIFTVLLAGAQNIFIGVGLVMFVYYGIRLVTESENESTISEVKEAYSYGITGAIIVGIGNFLLEAVGQGTGAESTLVNAGPVAQALSNIGLYFRLMVATALAGMIIFQGFRLILAQGDEGEFEKQRKRFISGIGGVTVILLSNIIVNSVSPSGYGSGDSMTLAGEVIGIVNFLLTLAGALALVCMLVSGLFLVVSIDEALKDRAKKAFIGSIVTMIILLTCSVILRFIVGLGTGGVASLTPFFVDRAYAQGVSGAANTVAGGLLPGPGNFAALGQFIVTRIWLLVAPIAVFVLVRYGFRMITSSDEGKIEGAKKTIGAIIVGVILSFIGVALFNAFYLSGGSWSPGSGAALLSDEIAGILNWVTVLAAPLGILIIVVSGIKVVGSMGKEDAGEIFRKNILSVAAGILLIILQPIISITVGVAGVAVASELGTPSPFPIISAIAMIVRGILLFLALIAVVVVIYAGISLIASVGNDDQYKKSKSLIVRALTGLLIILLSYTILRFVSGALGL